MKKVLLFFVLVVSFYANAQVTEVQSDAEVSPFNNEISIGLLDFITFQTVHVQYERFLPKNKAVVLKLGLFDVFNYEDFDIDDQDNRTVSFTGAYRFYMGNKSHSGVYFYPYAKLIVGEMEHTYQSHVNYPQTVTETYDATNFSLGFGIGYKWRFLRRFTLSADANIGRSIFQGENQNPNRSRNRVEFKPWFGFGYQF